MSRVKNVYMPYPIFGQAVSGTGSNSVIISSVTQVQYSDNMIYQFRWTGNPATTFFIQSSVDYNPGTPMSRGTQNDGTWDSLSLDPVPTTASGSSYSVNIQFLASPYIRAMAITSSGSGVISGYTSGKTVG